MSVLFVRKQFLVKIDYLHLPQVRLLVHGRLTHKQDDGLLVRHCATHPRDPTKVLLQPLYPVRGVYHGVDALFIDLKPKVRDTVELQGKTG